MLNILQKKIKNVKNLIKDIENVKNLIKKQKMLII